MRMKPLRSPCGACRRVDCVDHPTSPPAAASFDEVAQSTCARYLDWQALQLARNITNARGADRRRMKARLGQVRQLRANLRGGQ